jgi:hypothetical protein
VSAFHWTERQLEGLDTIAGPAMHSLLYGGSRSGKTLLNLWAVVFRALDAPGSRHAVLRFRFNHVKSSVVLDTFPKLMDLCFPEEPYEVDRTDWYATFPMVGSEVWFGGLDEKVRAEKILGNEYATVFLNECSQIPLASRNLALTRLAQKVTVQRTGKQQRLKMLYDCNPPNKGHWTYKLFFEHRDPQSKELLRDRENYAHLQMNPTDNQENLPQGYLDTLNSLPSRLRTRFAFGEFAEVAENVLWTLEGIETYRELGELPDLVRVVVAVDPSGASDEEEQTNDEIGIVVAGLGVDGVGYLLEDLTCRVGPRTWGNVATTAYDRHQADCIVGEVNFGGAMVEYVIQTQRKRTPYRAVTASRGKAVRAEPIAALAEDGKIRHAGHFHELEDELCSFTTAGYMGGEDSPNRADAYVWAFSELFAGIVQGPKRKTRAVAPPPAGGWMVS